jgi:adenosylmethionine-8-amino-7-oxononanoate aminotransferase
MAEVDGHEVTIVRGDGARVWDDRGKEYIDGAASLWHANIGHGNREVAAAIAAQLEQIETFHTFGVFSNRPANELAERLAGLAPSPGSKVLLGSGGGEAIETAVKLARLYHAVRGEVDRHHVISRAHAYHGTHGIGTSILGMPYREGFGPLLEDTSQVEWDSAVALEEEIHRVGPERVAAFVFEPVIGSGGVYVPPPGYLDEAVAVCRRHGVLAIADCVIAGFGRLGGWFGVERFHLTPDLITFAKGVTSGYLPLGGVMVAPEVAAPFWEQPGRMFAHGATYAGHATCCAAALANLDVLARDDLVHRALEIESGFHATLNELSSHPLMGEVRGGVGLMAGVALAVDALADDPDLPARLLSAAREAGVLGRGLRDGVAIAPPLIIDDATTEEMTERLGRALDRLR